MRISVDELVQKRLIPGVKSRRDVYALIRSGFLKAEKHGRRTVVVLPHVLDESPAGEPALTRRKRTTLGVKLTPVFSLFLGYALQRGTDNHGPSGMESYSRSLVERLECLARFIRNPGPSHVLDPAALKIELSDEMLETLDLIETELKKLRKLNRNKRIYNTDERKRLTSAFPSLPFLVAALVFSDFYVTLAKAYQTGPMSTESIQ